MKSHDQMVEETILRWYGHSSRLISDPPYISLGANPKKKYHLAENPHLLHPIFPDTLI